MINIFIDLYSLNVKKFSNFSAFLELLGFCYKDVSSDTADEFLDPACADPVVEGADPIERFWQVFSDILEKHVTGYLFENVLKISCDK